MTKQVILLCGDGADGPGNARIVDAVTGALLRDYPRGYWMTDSVEGYAAHNEFFYLVDSDSSLVCYDKDNVVKARIDLGYNDNSGEFIWVTSAGVHLLKNNKEFQTFTPGEENLSKLMTYAHGTLAVVTYVVLSNPLLADTAGNATRIQTHDKVFAPDNTGFWVSVNDATAFPTGGGFYKVGYDGAVLDTWDTAGALEIWSIHKSGTVDWYCPNTDYSGFNWRALDFPTKTLGASVTPANLSAAFTAAAPHNLGSLNSFSSDYNVEFLPGGDLRIPYSWGSGDDLNVPAIDGLGIAGGIAFFTLSPSGTAVCDSVIPLYQYDNVKRAVTEPRYTDYSRCAVKVNATDWVVGGQYGVYRVNAISGAVVWSFQFPNNVQQGYSGDGDDLEHLIVDTWDTYTVTGTLTDSAGVDNRKVRIHDQATGAVVVETVTDGGGTYAAELFSPQPKYIVCTSFDDTKNFGINAHIIPA